VLRHRGTLDELATAVGIFPTLAEGLEGTARGLLRRLATDAVAGAMAADRPAEPVNFQCAECAADYETQERLAETAAR
jgi:hypothetical protein